MSEPGSSIAMRIFVPSSTSKGGKVYMTRTKRLPRPKGGAEQVPSARKKIVLQHVTGPLAGFYQITGQRSDAPTPLPEFVPRVSIGDHHVPVSLVASKRSYFLYREVIRPTEKTFNPAQL